MERSRPKRWKWGRWTSPKGGNSSVFESRMCSRIMWPASNLSPAGCPAVCVAAAAPSAAARAASGLFCSSARKKDTSSNSPLRGSRRSGPKHFLQSPDLEDLEKHVVREEPRHKRRHRQMGQADQERDAATEDRQTSQETAHQNREENRMGLIVGPNRQGQAGDRQKRGQSGSQQDR